MEMQKECFQMWKGEAETRNRKTMQKQLPFSQEKTETQVKQNLNTQRTPNSQISSSLFPELSALKLDPDLDGNPTLPSSAPPPYNPTTLRRQERDSTTPQQSTDSEAAHPEIPGPPQNSTTTSSPIAHRLRHPNQNAAFNMPMVEVSGPEGATLVFRPWTSADITAASQHLPNPTTSGKIFTEQLLTFCQEFKPTMNELKRLLITKMKPTDWQKISRKFPYIDVRCKHITWEDESNAQYRDAVRHLCDAFTHAFPVKVNMEKITACKQKDDENPDEFLTRLTEVFNTNSGLQLPEEVGNTPDVWEIHLCNYFLNGLQPDISSAVKSSCIGWNDARLSELRRHAIHAYNQTLTRKKIKEETNQKELHLAAITMYNTVREQRQSSYDRRRNNRSHHKNWRIKPSNDICHLCGQHGHWKRDCHRYTTAAPEDKSD
ncbi:uncharacterized protein LOC113169931 [Anabas testudineus]|uniref:uncharacterized protein LOC113169931 n=1 Tax=Anabas testudineus TaxID=64144 RepID=UPI000E45803A|nr:uncharacterized protein LOC113169931 [Anabas testudineus]